MTNKQHGVGDEREMPPSVGENRGRRPDAVSGAAAAAGEAGLRDALNHAVQALDHAHRAVSEYAEGGEADEAAKFIAYDLDKLRALLAAHPPSPLPAPEPVATVRVHGDSHVSLFVQSPDQLVRLLKMDGQPVYAVAPPPPAAPEPHGLAARVDEYFTPPVGFTDKETADLIRDLWAALRRAAGQEGSELARDAGRFRWLEANINRMTNRLPVVPPPPRSDGEFWICVPRGRFVEDGIASGPTLGAAIDAAIAAAAPTADETPEKGK